MERATLSKFVFVLIIALGVLAISLYSIFGNDQEPENIEDMFSIDDENADEDFNVDDYINDSNQDEDNVTDDMMEGSLIDDEENTNSDQEVELHDYDSEIIESFGEERVDKAEEIAEEVMRLWLEEEVDLNEWEALVTEEFLYSLEDDLSFSSDSVTREIDSIQLYTVQANNENEILFEIEATWYLNQNGTLMDKQEKIFYVTVLMDNENELADNLIEL